MKVQLNETQNIEVFKNGLSLVPTPKRILCLVHLVTYLVGQGPSKHRDYRFILRKL